MTTPDGEQRAFLTGVVLAAGASTRMGRLKQLLPVGNRCLLQWVVDAALASSLDEVVVVLGHRAEEVRGAIALPEDGRARAIVAPDFARGQSTSLQRGLRAADARSQALAVLLGDQPGVSGGLIDRVAEAFLSAGALLARPVYPDAGGAPGHPVFLARRIWPRIEALSGDQGARGLFAARPDWLLEVPVPGDPPLDVDTWEDYQRCVTGYGSGRRATSPSGRSRPKGTR
jgi:molybdenum cofactor cytidylyltransferase